MPSVSTEVFVRHVRPIFARLSIQGRDVSGLFGALGLTPADLFSATTRIPAAKLPEAWALGTEMSADPDLGLHAAEMVDLRLLPVAHKESEYLPLQLLLRSATVGEGLTRFVRSYPLGNGAHDYRVDHADGLVRVSLVPRIDVPFPRALREFAIGFLVGALAQTTDGAVRPRVVEFVHPRPASTDEHDRVLGAPTRFGCAADAVVLTEAHWATPLVTSQSDVADALALQLEEQLAAHAETEPIVLRVRHLLDAEDVDLPNAADVARTLGLSMRTLGRRLDEAGTSFRELVDAARSDRAVRMLRAGMSLREVAVRLGFSEESAFRRAFRRWHGESPGEFVRRDREV